MVLPPWGRGRKPTNPVRDAVRTAGTLAAELPAGSWQALQVREGAVGPLVFEFAAVRVWGMRHRKPGPPCWLLIRRSLGAEPEFRYYVSNADGETPLSTLALVAGTPSPQLVQGGIGVLADEFPEVLKLVIIKGRGLAAAVGFGSKRAGLAVTPQ